MEALLSKIAKGFSSSLGVTIIGGIITSLLGLQIEYSFYQNDKNEPSHKVIIEKQNITNEMVVNKRILINNTREIKLVSEEFIFLNHKWYIRMFGVVILLFPFFFFPWSDHYKQKALALKIQYRHAYDSIIGKEMARNAWFGLLREYISNYIIYILAYFTLIYFIGKTTNFKFLYYCVLLVERILNYIVGLF